MENKLHPQNVRMNTCTDILSGFDDIFNKGFYVYLHKAEAEKTINVVKKNTQKVNKGGLF